MWRLYVSIGIALLVIGLLIDIVVFGYSSTTGGQKLDYDASGRPNDAQYAIDERFLCDYLEQVGFRKTSISALPNGKSLFNALPNGFIPDCGYEHPIPYSNPVLVTLYIDPHRSGFWLFVKARNSTLAVPAMHRILATLRLPFYYQWHLHVEATKAERN